MMPVFTDALLGDTLHLSAEEFGAYCLLLFATWRNNGRALAEDDRKMARICRVTPRRWRERLKPALRGFFNTDDGTWHQKRLEKEWQFCAENAAISRANGSKGGRPKLLNINGSRNPAGFLGITQNEPAQTQTQEDSSPVGELRSKPNGFDSSGKAQTPSRDVPGEMTTIWNEECGTITKARAPNMARKVNCLKRWREEFASEAEQWRSYCRRVASSAFLRGEGPRGWRADLDWVLKPEHLSHIMEGRYDDRLANGGGGSEGSGQQGPIGPAPSYEELFNDDGSRKAGLPH